MTNTVNTDAIYNAINAGMRELQRTAHESEINKLNTELRTQLIILTAELGKRFGIPVVQRALTEHPKIKTEFKIQSGTKKDIMANNNCDMLEGCLNRMHVTDEEKEFIQIAKSAQYYIHANTQLALERIGVITVPEWTWECPLFV